MSSRAWVDEAEKPVLSSPCTPEFPLTQRAAFTVSFIQRFPTMFLLASNSHYCLLAARTSVLSLLPTLNIGVNYNFRLHQFHRDPTKKETLVKVTKVSGWEPLPTDFLGSNLFFLSIIPSGTEPRCLYTCPTPYEL